MLKSQQIGYQSIDLVKLYNLLFEYIKIRRSVWPKTARNAKLRASSQTLPLFCGALAAERFTLSGWLQ